MATETANSWFSYASLLTFVNISSVFTPYQNKKEASKKGDIGYRLWNTF